MNDDVVCEILVDNSIAAAYAGETQDRPPIAKTGRVIQQVPDR